MKLTGGIITLNEEKNIEACLASLSFCEELLVVDAGSTDRTQELATQKGARVLTREWTGFADQRNFLLEEATHPWVLMLDADERFPEGHLDELRACLTNSKEAFVAFRFPRKTYYLGRWIAYGGWYPDYQTRLLYKNSNHFTNNLVHEVVESKGDVGTLRAPLVHTPFGSIADQVSTNNRYSSLLAASLKERKSHFSLFRLVTKPFVKFVECYFLKKGFRDGLPGFVIAVSAAYSVFLKWSKLWETRES